MRLSLAAVAYMLLQDRANVGLAGCGALRGLAALVRLVAEPRALGTPAATVAAAAPAGGWRKRIALGGKTEASNDKRLELEVCSAYQTELLTPSSVDQTGCFRPNPWHTCADSWSTFELSPTTQRVLTQAN